MKYFYTFILLTIINFGIDIVFQCINLNTWNFESGIIVTLFTLFMYELCDK